MLVWCCAIVCDDGPTANKRWLLVKIASAITVPANRRRWTSVAVMLVHRLRRWPSIKTTLVQRLVFAGFVVDDLTQQNTRRSPMVGTMLVHRLRRWPNIVPTLGKRLAFAGHFLHAPAKVRIYWRSFQNVDSPDILPAKLWIYPGS